MATLYSCYRKGTPGLSAFLIGFRVLFCLLGEFRDDVIDWQLANLKWTRNDWVIVNVL